MTIRCMRIACRITKVTHTHTQYAIFIAFSTAITVTNVTFRSTACLVLSCSCPVQCIMQKVTLLTGTDGIANPVLQDDVFGRL